MLSKALTGVAASDLQGEREAFTADAPESMRRLRCAERAGKYQLGPRMSPGTAGAFHFGIAAEPALGPRIVAIKRLHRQLARNPTLAERFRNEARINARVQEPHVVRLLDLLESEGELWQVLEYVDGETLLALQADVATWGRRLSLNVSVAILVGALRGLHAAHVARHENGLPLGIVHRAVTPRNIMIARSGQVKIIDFGSAKTTFKASSVDLAQFDDRVSYLSPEQVRSAPVDRRSDVFSAGVVLWEALTGRSLFGDGSATSAAILEDIENQPIAAPSSVRPEIPRALDQAVLIALQREPAHRFQSALEFARALEQALPPASASLVGSYVNVYCEPRLTRRQQLIRASETRSALEGLGWRVSTPQAPDDDDAEAVTLLAIPSTESCHTPPLRDGTSKSGLARLPHHTLWAGAAAVALVVFASLGWSVWRPIPPGHWLAPSPAQATKALQPGPMPVTEAIAPVAFESQAVEQPIATTAAVDSVKRETPTPSSAAILPHRSSFVEAPVRGVQAGNSTASSRAKYPAAARSGSSGVTLDCTPPTYLGSDGIHHFKEHCL